MGIKFTYLFFHRVDEEAVEENNYLTGEIVCGCLFILTGALSVFTFLSVIKSLRSFETLSSAFFS